MSRRWWQFWQRKPLPRLYATLVAPAPGERIAIYTMGSCGPTDIRYVEFRAPLHPDSDEGVKS